MYKGRDLAKKKVLKYFSVSQRCSDKSGAIFIAGALIFADTVCYLPCYRPSFL